MKDLRELEDICGIVSTKREPLVIPEPPEDQSQPGPWWVVPAFALMALAMVFCGYLIAEAAPLLGVK